MSTNNKEAADHIADERRMVESAEQENAQDWTNVKDGLPETFVTDDSECWLQGRRINAAINSVRVLVALSQGGIRVDRLEGIEGSAPYWETYRDRVTHWKPLPQHPENKQ